MQHITVPTTSEADQLDVRDLPLAELIAQCEGQARNFRNGQSNDERYAWELVSRAIRGGQHRAWQALIDLYGRQIVAHIRRHPAYTAIGEDEAFWVNRTFQRFIHAVGPERLDKFPNLAAVLGYLNMCGFSVLLDELRVRQRAPQVSLEAVSPDTPSTGSVEDAAVDRLVADAIWETVLAELPDDTERLMARLSLKLGYKPGEIYALHTHLFSGISDVYWVKRSMLDRLRRSRKLRALLAHDRDE